MSVLSVLSILFVCEFVMPVCAVCVYITHLCLGLRVQVKLNLRNGAECESANECEM